MIHKFRKCSQGPKFKFTITKCDMLQCRWQTDWLSHKRIRIKTPKKNIDRLTSINCNSIMLQHMAASRLWRGVLFPSAVPQIKIVGWAYFFDIILSTIENIFLKHNFKDVPAVFFASGRMRGKVGRRLLYLHFLLQVRHLLASHRNHKYPNATKNIKMPPQISKWHQKYSNGTKNN